MILLLTQLIGRGLCCSTGWDAYWEVAAGGGKLTCVCMYVYGEPDDRLWKQVSLQQRCGMDVCVAIGHRCSDVFMTCHGARAGS